MILSSTLVLADDFVPEEEEESSADTFIIGSADSGGDITLQFGNVLNKYVRWDTATSNFVLNDDLDLSGSQLINTRLENLAVAPTCDGGSIGRLYYDTVQSDTFVCDGAVWSSLSSGAGGGVSDLATARYSHSLVTNINAAALDNIIPWDTEDFEDTAFVHDTVTNNSRVQVTDTAKYLVSGAVSVNNTVTNNFRYNGRLKFRVNGTTTLAPRFQPGYIRRTGGQDETSLVFSIVMDLAANDYFEVLVDRESTNGAAANMLPGESSLSIVKLQSSGGSGGGGAPYITSSSLVTTPSSTQNISVVGTGFLPTSTVSIPGFGGTINTTTVISPTQIDLNITTDGTQANYDVVVDNSGVDNTVWPGNGVGVFEVALVTGTGPAGTYTEGFEGGLGSWSDSGLDQPWTNNNGGTPSAGTGPLGAGTGTFYLYAETSGNGTGYPNRTFGVETSNFNVAQSVTFDYHMFGPNIGTLEFQTQYQGVWTTRWSLTGQQQAAQGDPYTNQFIDLTPFQVEAVRFFYTSGPNWDSDTAIDNVVIIST